MFEWKYSAGIINLRSLKPCNLNKAGNIGPKNLNMDNHLQGMSFANEQHNVITLTLRGLPSRRLETRLHIANLRIVN